MARSVNFAQNMLISASRDAVYKNISAGFASFFSIVSGFRLVGVLRHLGRLPTSRPRSDAIFYELYAAKILSTGPHMPRIFAAVPALPRVLRPPESPRALLRSPTLHVLSGRFFPAYRQTLSLNRVTAEEMLRARFQAATARLLRARRRSPRHSENRPAEGAQVPLPPIPLPPRRGQI